MNFKEFDPNIGVDGYCHAIRQILFPNSTPSTVDAAALNLHYRIYVKGSVFSRVRPIQDADVEKFLNNSVTRKEFFPPSRSVAEVQMGRFNVQGERKLYLADHPFVALKECGIQPGQHFLFSYFTLKADTYFIDAETTGSEFAEILNELFQSEDKRFYEVINRVYKSYLDHQEFQGIAYSSVRVPNKFNDEVWGEISSTTNLAMKEDHMPSAELVAGWLARCDELYRPSHLRMFASLNPKKKNKLTALTYHGNKSDFISSTNAMLDVVRDLRRKSELRIQKKDYADPKISPVKFSFKD